MPPKGKNTKKKGGERKGYTNPPAKGFASKTKQKTLRESLQDTSVYIPLQGSPQQELELLKILFPSTFKAYEKQKKPRNKIIRKYIGKETYESHISTLYNDEMHYKDKYPAVNDLIKCFFRDNSTNPTITQPPELDNQERYMYKKEISDELSQTIRELVPAVTNNDDDSSATTLGRGSPFSDTTASDYSPKRSASTNGSKATTSRVSLPRKGKALIPSESARREEKTIEYKSTTPNSLKVKTAIQTEVHSNSRQPTAKGTPSQSTSPSSASSHQDSDTTSQAKGKASKVLGMINRILSPKNQDQPTFPDSVTFLTQNKNNSIPEEEEDDIEEEEDDIEDEKSTEVETNKATEIRRKNPILARMKYPTANDILRSDASDSHDDESSDESSNETKPSKNQTQQDDPSSEENLEIQQKFPAITQMEQQFEEQLDNWDSENATEVVSKFQEMFTQLTTFNEQIRLEQEESINKLAQREIKITDCLLEIENQRIDINDRERNLKKRETNLEVKWKEMTETINKYKDRFNDNHTPSADQVTRIETQIQEGLTQIKEKVNNTEGFCTLQLDSFTEQATKHFRALEKLNLEQQLQSKKYHQDQRDIFDQAIKDNMLSITAIKEETVAQNEMVNKRLDKSNAQNKNMEQLMVLAQQRQDALLSTIDKSNDISNDHSKYLTNLKLQKEKIKADLQAYTPKSIDIQIDQVSQDLDEAMLETKMQMKRIAQNVERTFKKKLSTYSKKEAAKDTEAELVGAIDEANNAIEKLNASAHLSKVRRLQANHETERRISNFLESNQLRMAVDEQTEAGINDYLNKHPERLNFLLSQHIANTAGKNDAIKTLVEDTAQKAVDHYFRKDDNTYLKNFVERVSHTVVNHHLTTIPSLATETYEEETVEQRIHQEQATATTARHPMFRNVRFNDEDIQIQNQGGHQQGIYSPIASEHTQEENQLDNFQPIAPTSTNNYRRNDTNRNNAIDSRGRGRGRGRSMPIFGHLASRRPAGGFGPVSNSSTVDSTRQKELIRLRTKTSTVLWPEKSFPTMRDAASIYSEIAVTLEQYGLPIVPYDDLQKIGNTLPKGYHPDDDDIKIYSSILFGYMSFNASSNPYIRAILSPYEQVTNGYAALYAFMYRTTPWFRDEKLDWATTPFTDDIDPSQYATIILDSAKTAFKQGGTKYSITEQSKEMLYQIMKGQKYSKIATKLLAEIDILTAIYPGCVLPTYLQVPNLALTIAVHPECTTITINAVDRTGGNKASPRPSTPYQRKNPAKQCICCGMHGHCIDVKDKKDKKDFQICRIGAQIYNVKQYTDQHPEEMAINATMYREINEPKHVRLVQLDRNPSEFELEDECEKAYIEDLTSTPMNLD